MLCLYSPFAIRGANWNLRVASLKLMAPLFSAYDRDVYQRILPNHLADIQLYPQHIIQSFKAGGFTVNITGRKWHCVALDEAHEMCINKDLKLATTYPTTSYLQKTTLFFNYRIAAYKNFLQQLFPTTPCQSCPQVTDDSLVLQKKEENIKKMCECIVKSSLLPLQTTNRGIVNCFSGEKATSEQNHDMLQFRVIGAQLFLDYVSHRILMNTCSTDQAPLRKRKLFTMSKPRVTRKKISQKEKEAKIVAKCLRRRLAWCNRLGQSYNPTEQYSRFPRALADEFGNPHKAPKKSWTDKIASRYKSAKNPVMLSTLDPAWNPETVIIDAMFLLNTSPLRSTKTIAEYCSLLFNRYAFIHYKTGTKCVHFIFDMPNDNQFNPKLFEQSRRDMNIEKPDHTAHQHHTFTPTTAIPRAWRNVLQCRQCKRSLVEAIGLAFLQTGNQLLRNGQSLVLGGCFEGDGNAWTINPNTGILPTSTYTSSNLMQLRQISAYGGMPSTVPLQRFLYIPQTLMFTTLVYT